MASFTSKYEELMFFVDGEPRKFKKGSFSTEDKKEIEVLSKIIDAVRVDEEKAAPKKPEPKTEAKTEEKPKATRSRSTRKKASDK
jgi:hypothetical protein